MRANFVPLMREVLRHEGGFSDDRQDPGNWTGGKVGVGVLKGTKYGIAANSHPHLDIRNLTQDEAIEIYREQYAPPVMFDDLPSGIDWVALDASINSGPKRSVVLIQRALGFSDEDADGRMGPKTLAAIKAANQPNLIRGSCRQRLDFMRSLKTWNRYGRGWTTRVNEVQAKALKMVGESAVAA